MENQMAIENVKEEVNFHFFLKFLHKYEVGNYIIYIFQLSHYIYFHIFTFILIQVNQISKELDNKIEENFYLVQQKDELQKNLNTANNEKNDVETRLTETLDENVQLKAEKDGIANRLEKEIDTISRIEKLAQQMKIDIAVKDKEIVDLKNKVGR